MIKKIKKNKNNRAIFLEDVLSFCIYYLLYVYIYIYLFLSNNLINVHLIFIFFELYIIDIRNV